MRERFVSFGLVFLAPLIVLLTYAALAWLQPITFDSGVYYHVGRIVAEGGTPYVDTWDHKGPLLYLLNAAGILLAGNISGVYLLEGSLIAMALTLSGLIWRRVLPDWAVCYLGVGLFLSYLAIFDRGNFTESWQLPFNLLAYSALASWLLARAGLPAWAPPAFLVGLAIGVAGGVAAAIRISNGPGVAAAALVLVAVAGVQRRNAFLGIGLGGLAVVLPAFGYIAASGAWDAMIDQYLRYNFLYVGGSGREARLASLTAFAARGWPMPLALLTPALLIGLATSSLRSVVGRPALLFIAIGAAEAVGVASAGRPYPHYLIMILPVLTVLSGLGFVAVAGRGRRLVAPRPALAALAILALLPGLAIGAKEVRRIYQSAYSVNRVADYIRNNSEPDDTVLSYGWSPGLAELAGRPAPSFYSYMTPLVTGNYATETDLNRFLSEVQAAEPKLIVRGMNTCAFETVNCDRPDAYTEKESERLRGIRDWIVSNYTISKRIGVFEIWERN